MRFLTVLSVATALFGLQTLQSAASQALSVSVADATFQPETNGGTGRLSFNATLGGGGTTGIPSGTQVMLVWSTGDQTARGGANCGPGIDYLTQSQVGLTLSASQPAGLINVAICGDARDEANETFSVALSVSGGSAGLTRNFAIGTIVDDDPAPTIGVGAAQGFEGNAGIAAMAFPVVLSTVSGQQGAATVQTDVTGLTATQAANCAGGADLQPTSGQLSIAEGLDRGVVNVPICGDTAAEPDQTFRVRLTGASNAGIGTNSTAIGTILNDDAMFSVSDMAVTEPVSGTRTASFTVRLSSASTNEVRVNYRTADGTALSTGPGTGPWNCSTIDYFPVSGTLSIPAGGTSGVVNVSICGGDARGEPNQTFYLDLSSPVGTTILDARGAATIRDAFPPRLRLP